MSHDLECDRQVASDKKNDDSTATTENPVDQEKGEAVASDMVMASEQVKEVTFVTNI